MHLVTVVCAGSLLLLALTSRASAERQIPSDAMKVQMDVYYEEADGTEPIGRVKRGFWDRWKDRRDRTKNKKEEATTTTKAVKKPRKKMDVKIVDAKGNEKSYNFEMVKSLSPKVAKYGLGTGQVAEETSESTRSYEVFSDNSNGTGSVMLMSCDKTGSNCVSFGSFMNGTESLLIEPWNSNPYASKGKRPNEELKGSAEERAMGVASDGTSLGIPINTRKKRDINLTPRMRRSLRRKRREAVTSHVVELLILVDYSEYAHWLDRSSSAEAAETAMELYFIMMTNMMDDRFATIYDQKEDVEITFMINAIVYARTEAEDPWETDNELSDSSVNVNAMLDDLTRWAWTQRANYPSHDHVIAVSGLNLAAVEDGEVKTSILGVAWSGGMCDTGYSLSIIEDAGLGLIDYIATHELGHSMSSTHDSKDGCSDADFFVMGTNGGSPSDGLYGTGNEANPWTFSACATNAIYDFIQGLGSGSCLLSSTFDKIDYDAYKAYMAPGVLIPLDTQCELQYGIGSRRCFTLDASICSDGAYCWNPADPSYCYTLYVRQGSVCGEMMRCDHGVCVDNTLVMPTCPPELNGFTPEGNVAVVSAAETTVSPPSSLATNRYLESASQIDLEC